LLLAPLLDSCGEVFWIKRAQYNGNSISVQQHFQNAALCGPLKGTPGVGKRHSGGNHSEDIHLAGPKSFPHRRTACRILAQAGNSSRHGPSAVVAGCHNEISPQ